jgi:hypothetical protein
MSSEQLMSGEQLLSQAQHAAHGLDAGMEAHMTEQLKLMVRGDVWTPEQEPWLSSGPEPVLSAWFVPQNGPVPRVVGWTRSHVAVRRADGYTTFETRHMATLTSWSLNAPPPHEALLQLERWLVEGCFEAVLEVTRWYELFDGRHTLMPHQEALAPYRAAARAGHEEALASLVSLELSLEQPCVVSYEEAWCTPSGERYEFVDAAHLSQHLGWASRRGVRCYRELVRAQEAAGHEVDPLDWQMPEQVGGEWLELPAVGVSLRVEGNRKAPYFAPGY